MHDLRENRSGSRKITHNPEVSGSNPLPATELIMPKGTWFYSASLYDWRFLFSGSNPTGGAMSHSPLLFSRRPGRKDIESNCSLLLNPLTRVFEICQAYYSLFASIFAKLKLIKVALIIATVNRKEEIVAQVLEENRAIITH
jgi:hypothetical protein